MLALHMMPHQLVAFRVLVVMLGIAGLIFWRATFKIIIALAVLLIVLMAGAFAAGFFEGIYHSIR